MHVYVRVCSGEVVCAMGDKGCTLIVSSLFLLVLDFLKCFSPSPPFFKY